MKKTTLKVLAGAALAGLSALPAAAQEAGDSVLYEGDPFPVWVAVEDGDEAGAHRIEVMIRWADSGSILPFSADIEPGGLSVLLPVHAGALDLTESCAYTTTETTAYGGGPALAREDDYCSPPVVERIDVVAVEYDHERLACDLMDPLSGEPSPNYRVFACYWEGSKG